MSMLEITTVREYLCKEDTDGDDVLFDLMNRAVEAVQRELDWYFGVPRATAEVLHGSGCADIWLRQPPANGLVVQERTSLTDPWEVVDTADYENEARAVWHATIWLLGTRNYRFEYDEGFTSPPGDVVQLTLDLIASKWRKSNQAGLKSERLGRYAYTLGDLQSMPQWSTVRANWARLRV
jgi:hypothetical protein